MRLLTLELRKFLRLPAVWGFLLVCLAVNTIAVFATSHKQEIDILNAMQEIPVEEYNPFEELRGGEIIKEQLLAERKNIPAPALKLLLWKYDLLGPEILAKAERRDGDAPYFGEWTQSIHFSIFHTLGRLFAMESGLFCILIMLFALGYEGMSGSDLVGFSSKAGRGIARQKIAAALLLGVAFFAIIHAVGYGLTFAVNDFTKVWSQNISAREHWLPQTTFLGTLPFITWRSMEIGQYFWGCVGVSFLNCLVLSLFAMPFGLLARNVYGAFCTLAGSIFLHIMFFLFWRTHTATPFVWYLSFMPPVTQFILNQTWFSCGGGSMLLPHFEWFYPLICAALLCPALLVCAKKFKRKEL